MRAIGFIRRPCRCLRSAAGGVARRVVSRQRDRQPFKGNPTPSREGMNPSTISSIVMPCGRCPRAARFFASTPSATRRSGATRCGSTRRSPAQKRRRRSRRQPRAALALGLKVDVERASAEACVSALQTGRARISTTPATTLALLALNAVVGVTGFFDERPTDLASASSARCVTRPSTIASRPASASAWTAGRTGT